jgi:hypothetical protein
MLQCLNTLQASVSNVSSVLSHACCKCVYVDVAYISHICCKCFVCMLRMFCNDFQMFSCVFTSVQTHVSSVSSAFGHIFQMLHPDVSKVD